MSAMPTSPVISRDLRSEDRPFKKDRDNRNKWIQGVRPLGGQPKSDIFACEDPRFDIMNGAKVRPARQWTHQAAYKRGPNPNRDTKLDNSSTVPGKMTRKTAPLDSAPLSRSLLELLPTHANNTSSSIQIMSSVPSVDDAGVLYSFDNPTTPGKKVELGGLVEKAEIKWVEAQTEKMVKDNYEVLDIEGAVVRMGKGKKGRKSPRTKAAQVAEDYEDDFEIIDLSHY